MNGAMSTSLMFYANVVQRIDHALLPFIKVCSVKELCST